MIITTPEQEGATRPLRPRDNRTKRLTAERRQEGGRAA